MATATERPPQSGVGEPAPLARCQQVSVTWGEGEAQVVALATIDLEIAAGETVGIVGASGSGKTTLLHALGGLIAPTSGSVEWEGTPLPTIDAAGGSRGIAYVFQGSNLLPTFTARENVAFAATVAASHDEPWHSPDELLGLVGLSHRVDRLPAELSGGEAQRVAIARALAVRPRMLLCDEPTGHLDTDTGVRVMDLVQRLQERFGFALVVATHDTSLAGRMSRIVQLEDGNLAGDRTRVPR